MSLDPILITSDMLSRVAMTVHKQRIGQPVIGGRKARPFMRFLESIKQTTGVSGEDGAMVGNIQFSPGLQATWLRDEDAIGSPQQINHLIQWEATYARTVVPVKVIHDEWLRKGYRIARGVQAPGSKAVKLTNAQFDKLKVDVWDNMLEAAVDNIDEILDLSAHRIGASSKELFGLNGQLPIYQTGTWCGHDRANQPLVRHIVRGSTVGSGGTLRTDLRKIFRDLNLAAQSCKLPKGQFFLMAGADWIDAYIDECERAGVQYQADLGGVSKIDGVILDDAVRVGRLNCYHNPTLDTMDSVAVSERGAGVSTATATFSGGGATKQATGLVYVNAAGQVTAIVITDPGEGYTSAPTVTLGAVGSGSGASFQANIYATSAGTGKIVVNADDNRIGRIAGVTVNAAGSNYPVGDVVPFSKRCYILYKPAWAWMPVKGLDRELIIPADPARTLTSELQWDWAGYLINKAPFCNAVSYIK